MSHENPFDQWATGSRIDVTLAKLGLILSVLLLGLRLLTPQVLVVVIPTALGVACVVYLGVQNRSSTEFEYALLPRRLLGYFPSFVFVGLAAVVLMTHAAGSRTVSTHLLTGAIGALIFAQILAVDEDALSPGLILVQLIAAAVVVRLTALFVTPGFIGVDVWTHVPIFVDGIADGGNLRPLADSKYSMAPLYHTLGAVAALVFRSARTGVFLSVGLLTPLAALFVYGTGKVFLPARWSLLATALFLFADQVIRWGIHVIPTSLGLVFFLGALFAITSLLYVDDVRIVGFLFAFSLATVFTHQLSTVILLTLLGAATVTIGATRLVGGRTEMNSGVGAVGIVGAFLTTLIVTTFSWLNTPWIDEDPFLWQMIDTLGATLRSDAGFLNLAGDGGAGGAGGAAGGSTGLIGSAIPFVEWFGFAVLLSATIVGALAMLRMDTQSEVTLTYLFAGALMFVVVFGFSLFGIRSILPGRWIGFMYALFSIVGAVGLYYLSQHASRRVLLVVLLVVAVGYPATMAVSEKATLDSPAFGSENPRFAYTESEIAAVNTISTIHPPTTDRIIDTDHPYRTLFTRLGGYDARTAELDAAGSTSTRPMIARTYQQRGAASFEAAGASEASIASRTVAPDRVCSPVRNRIYANDAVEMCTTPGVETGDRA